MVKDEAAVVSLLEHISDKHVLQITGQSGAGKGTLADALASYRMTKYHPKVISTGEEFRKGIKTNFSPDMCSLIEEVNDAGGLQDPLDATSLVIAELQREWRFNRLTIIEGSPRTVKEASYLYDYCCNRLKRKVILINLIVSDELAIERMIKRNKEDEKAGRAPRKDTATPEARQKKVAYYHEHVAPAVKFMRMTLAQVITIHADDMTPVEVLEHVLNQLPVGDTVKA